MKKIEIKFLSFYNAIIIGLLAALGFASSCKKNNGTVEYGTPSALFIVNGQVKSNASNEAIENIKVYMQSDSALTDHEGKFKVIAGEFPKDQTFSIQFKDVDGAANGEYANLDTLVEFKDPQFTNGDGSWYAGETTKGFDVKLSPKK